MTTKRPPKVLLRPVQEPYESLQGYLMRLDLINSTKKHNPLLLRINLAMRTGVARRDVVWQEICSFLPHGISPVDDILFKLRILNVDGLGSLLKPSDSFMNFRFRFCPLCLEEELIHQRAWTMPMVFCCGKHRKELLDTCKCGSKLSWANIRLNWRCECGCSLNKLETTGVDDSNGLGFSNKIETLFKAMEVATLAGGDAAEAGSELQKIYERIRFVNYTELSFSRGNSAYKPRQEIPTATLVDYGFWKALIEGLHALRPYIGLMLCMTQERRSSLFQPSYSSESYLKYRSGARLFEYSPIESEIRDLNSSFAQQCSLGGELMPIYYSFGITVDSREKILDAFFDWWGGFEQKMHLFRHAPPIPKTESTTWEGATANLLQLAMNNLLLLSRMKLNPQQIEEIRRYWPLEPFAAPLSRSTFASSLAHAFHVAHWMRVKNFVTICDKVYEEANP